MAAILSFSFSLDSSNQQSLLLKTHLLKSYQTSPFTLTSPKSSHPLLLLHKFNHGNFTPCFSSSSSPSESSYLNDSSTQSPSESYPNDSSTQTQSPSESYLNDPLRLNGFITTQELNRLQILENFQYFHEFESGSLCIRVMDAEEMDITVGLLSESFAESMGLPARYVNILAFLVKQYMIERRALRPNTATLIGYYRDENGDEILAGTVEVSFNKKGSNASPPSPTPPRESPYICNMTVKKELRRRGIGWHLLKACEELISQMHDTSREVYLHCRMIDTAPFNMYTKAGYNVIKTDNFLILLTFQRRKHLMCKTLPVYTNPSESDTLSSEAYADHEFPSESDIPSSADHEFPLFKTLPVYTFPSESDTPSSEAYADHEFPSESDIPSSADHEFPSESDTPSSEAYADHEFPSESDIPRLADHEFPSESDIPSSADHEFPSESDTPSSQAYADHELPSESDIPRLADHELPSESDIPSSADHEFPSETDIPSSSDHEFPSESDIRSSEDYADHEFPR